MIVLRLAAGGRVAVRGDDVSIAQNSSWGSIITLAGNGAQYEVEQNLTQLRDLVPGLWFQGPGLILNPDHIASIWEEGGELHYRLAGGVEFAQAGADLHQFMAAIEDAPAQRGSKPT